MTTDVMQYHKDLHNGKENVSKTERGSKAFFS